MTDDKKTADPKPPREKTPAEKARNARWFGRLRVQKQLIDMDHRAAQDEFRERKRT
jgi:hypothetical protein